MDGWDYFTGADWDEWVGASWDGFTGSGNDVPASGLTTLYSDF